MGNPKQKWTAEEEEALRAGVAKHGTGKWKNIQRDPEFNHLLFSRSNIDLKDKWRNLSVAANGQGARDKSRAPKAKANANANASNASVVLDAAAVAPAAAAAAAPSAPLGSVPSSHDTAGRDTVVEETTKCLLDGKTASKYNAMIYEALSTLQEPNGSDTSTIVSFIERRHEVPPNFRRLLSSRLRRLVAQEKLEKVQNCYRIKRDPSSGPKPSAPKPKDIRPRQSPSNSYLGETLQEATVAAAYKIAEAENKSFVAAEAVKESERVLRMAEDSDSVLQLAKDIFDQCSRGEVMLVA